MKGTTISASLPLPNQALLFDLDALYACLEQVADRRRRQGLRYPLADILLIGVLAKLAGSDSSRAIAHWAKLRAAELACLFHLKRASMPHSSTWSRVLGHGVDPEQIEQAVGQFFAQMLQRSSGERGSIQLAIDGKTLRGTIPLGKSQGVHLLAAYLPAQGVVLAQMQVDSKTNELGSAPSLLSRLDLRAVVVSGDAMFDQRELSMQIVRAKGDYLWIVKDNQPALQEEIATLFEPEKPRPATSAKPPDFRTARPWRKDMDAEKFARSPKASCWLITAPGQSCGWCSSSRARGSMP